MCVHNSGRSQMAEAFFNRLARDRATSSSAGSQPASEINPAVVQVMREANIDISHQKPKVLNLEMMENADRVITMGCGAENLCPAAFVPMEDWQIEDPEGKPISAVREIRDLIKMKVALLVKELYVEGSIISKGGE